MTNKIEFEIISGLYENFINYLIEKDIYISNIKPSQIGLICVCYAKDYKKISRAAKKFQCRTKIIKKHGIYFLINKIGINYSMIFAICTVFVYIFIFTKIIWRIEVISLDNKVNNEIYNLLYENQIYTGSVFSKEKNHNIRQKIFMSIDDVGYVTLNFYKGVLVCKVDLAQHKMPYTQNTYMQNIVAAQDGVIEDLRVYDGFSDLKIGQSVTKGDILVSSTYIDANGNLQQVNPRAYIKAHCVKKYYAEINFNEKKYLRTGETSENIILKIFGQNIKLKKENLTDFKNYDIEKTFNYVDFLGFCIPATIEKNIYYKKEILPIVWDEKNAAIEAKETVDEIIKNDLALEKIDFKEYSYNISENKITVICTVQGHYDITK